VRFEELLDGLATGAPHNLPLVQHHLRGIV
jgi:hypothetical protein